MCLTCIHSVVQSSLFLLLPPCFTYFSLTLPLITQQSPLTLSLTSLSLTSLSLTSLTSLSTPSHHYPFSNLLPHTSSLSPPSLSTTFPSPLSHPFSALLQEHQSTVGKLFFQGTFQVSEPKFAIKAEKERQVFVFDTVIVFARKVSLEQGEFKYEYKSKIAVS